MRLICINSGSNGNEYIVKSKGKYFILDCGAKWKETMIACGFNVRAIEIAFVTHSHG